MILIKERERSVGVVFKKKGIILLSFFILSFIGGGKSVFAQLEDRSLPASFGFSAKRAVVIPESVLDSVHMEVRQQEDKWLGIPNRYGIVQQLAVDIREKGVKTKQGSINIWRYKISCPDALSLGVFLETYELPEGAALYLYSEDQTRRRGGFTSTNNKATRELALADFKGNSLVLEYNEPDDVDFLGVVKIGSVSTAYADFTAEATGRVQVNCPEGADWQTEKHAVCQMSYHDNSYSYSCSGALINNVRKDGTPYFLTANHCIATNSLARTLVVYFNYENSTCTGNDASLSQSLSGATLRSASEYSDFCLLELSEYPDDEYEAYYAGWDATGGAIAGGAGIHHPDGAPKCISIENDAPTSYNYLVEWTDEKGNTLSTTQRNTHWAVYFDDGWTEGGSSGSPFFNTEKRIVGQLHGGDGTLDLYGKFSLSWDHLSASTEQLKVWLDPDNTGALTLDGMEYHAPPVALFHPDVTETCLSAGIMLTDESENVPTSWNWKIEPSTYYFVNHTSASSQNPEVMFTAEGSYSVTLVVSNEYGEDTLLSDDLITVSSVLPVSFVGVSHEITLCGYELDSCVLTTSGASEYAYEISKPENFDYSVADHAITLHLTDEALHQGDFDTYVKVTGTHGDCWGTDSILLHVEMPMNDYVQYAIPLQLGHNASFNNRCATVEAGEPHPESSGCQLSNNWCPPAAGDSVLNNSVWYTFIGPSSHNLTIQTDGFDSQIAVYEAGKYEDLLSGDSSFSFLAANDDGASDGVSSSIQDLKVAPGRVYWLQVDGKDGADGEYSINLLSNTVEAYPNPSDGVFHIIIGTYEDGLADISIFNSLGQQVLKTSQFINKEENTFDMDLSEFPAGIYIFRVTVNGLTMSGKLIRRE